MTGKAANNEERWKPTLREVYDSQPGGGYFQSASYRGVWKMTRPEGDKVLEREMTWYERLSYRKGLPLGMDSWNINEWAFFTFVACLLVAALFEGRLPLELDTMFWQVARFIMFATIARLIFALIMALTLEPFARRRSLKK